MEIKALLKKTLYGVGISLLTILLLVVILLISGHLRIEDDNGNVLLGRSKDESELSADGPYIMYPVADSLLISKVVKDIEGYKVERKMVGLAERDQYKFTVNTEVKNKVTQFNFNLQESIEIPPTYYHTPPKLLAISDIEGNFYAFEKILKSQKVISDDYEWIYGDGHLVLLGDFFDRGLQVTQCLWLIYKLEQQAKEAGGRVHFILGNHEEMNLRGNQQYARNKYKLVAQELNRDYPSLYSSDTELGRWLRSKNIVEKIGDTIFTHGGLSPKLLETNMDLEKINTIARTNLGIKEEELKDDQAQLIFGSKGPMWYRGYFNDENLIGQMGEILAFYQASSIVVGHTLVEDMHSGFEQRVFAIDVEQSHPDSDKPARALLIKDGILYKVTSDGGRSILGEIKQFNKLKN